MPRPILHIQSNVETKNKRQISTSLSIKKKIDVNVANPLVLSRILRKNRSKEYLDAIHKLDAGGHVQMHQVDRLIDALRTEFPEINLPSMLIGLVAKCYLGDPYEVHTVDLVGGIIKHYKKGEILPDGMEKARNLAYSGFYDVIEVYSDCCRAISPSGNVSVVSI